MPFRSAAAALVQSVRNPDLREIATEAADITLDAVVDSGALEAVPIIQWIVKGKKAISAIRDQLFYRKVCRFLTRASSVPEEERDAFASKMAGDAAYQERVGESFLLWLDKLNSMEKVDLLGRIFAALIKKRIDLDEAVAFAEIVDHAYLPYLRGIAPSSAPPHSPDLPRDSAILTHLTSLGLAQFEAKWEAVDRQFKRDVAPRDIELLEYRLTPLAYRLSSVMFEDDLGPTAV